MILLITFKYRGVATINTAFHYNMDISYLSLGHHILEAMNTPPTHPPAPPYTHTPLAPPRPPASLVGSFMWIGEQSPVVPVLVNEGSLKAKKGILLHFIISKVIFVLLIAPDTSRLIADYCTHVTNLWRPYVLLRLGAYAPYSVMLKSFLTSHKLFWALITYEVSSWEWH